MKTQRRTFMLLPILAVWPVANADDGAAISDKVIKALAQYTESQVPGLQYVVVDAHRTLFEFAGGWADIQNQKAMSLDTTLMAYSMTKTYTATAILQLAQRGRLKLDDVIDRYLPQHAYGGHQITIRQLLSHTAGVPNPIPLRWVHLAEENEGFDEDAALTVVVQENSNLSFVPGEKFSYSNIGYWLLGKIVEQASGQSYTNYVKTNILRPLAIAEQSMDFVIPTADRHANGYLAKYSMMNLVKGFFIDKKFLGGYEGKWLRLKSHQLNGPAFGGLVGTARSFGRFLQDQLRSNSVLLNPETKKLMQTQQTTGAGKIPMTLGWHIGQAHGLPYLFKEGGGGGFHSEMRLYPSRGIASVVMVNSTDFNTTGFLNRLDSAFLESLS